MAHTERTIKADDKVIMDDNDKADDKRTIIIEYIHRNGEAKTEDLGGGGSESGALLGNL